MLGLIFLKKFFMLTSISLTAALISVGCAGKSSSTATPEPPTAAITQSSDTAVTESTDSETATATTTAADNKPVIDHNIKSAEGTYVYDEAKLLDSEAFKTCNDYAGMLYEKYLINAAVVTADKLDGQDPYAYAADAYDDLYEGRGSGLLLLLNNDTGRDILYTTGGCQSYITDEAEKEAFFWSTKDIVAGDYKSAVLRMLQLGEKCPEYVFNNAGLISAEQVGKLERTLSSGNNPAALLLTTNSTGKSNEDILKSYYTRRFKDGKGYMAMIDAQSKKVIAYSSQPLSSDIENALKKANESAAKDDYETAAETIAEALAG